MKPITKHDLEKQTVWLEREIERIQRRGRILSPREQLHAAQLKKRRLWVKDRLLALSITRRLS